MIKEVFLETPTGSGWSTAQSDEHVIKLRTEERLQALEVCISLAISIDEVEKRETYELYALIKQDRTKAEDTKRS